jgi:hypothetical protein
MVRIRVGLFALLVVLLKKCGRNLSPDWWEHVTAKQIVAVQSIGLFALALCQFQQHNNSNQFSQHVSLMFLLSPFLIYISVSSW